MKPPFDQALQLGLRPYAEFHEKMSPLFRRINSHERDGYLRDIYRLAAEKVLIEKGKTDAGDQACEFAEEAEKVQSATAHIEDASRSLLEAAGALPYEFPGRSEVKELASQLHDLGRRLADKGQELTRFAGELRTLHGKNVTVSRASPSSLQYAVQLQGMEEVAPDLPSGEKLLADYIRTLTGSTVETEHRYQFPSGRPLTAADHWLISAIDKSLPEAPHGKRLRISRDEVICTTFESALGDSMRSSAGVRSVRRRPKPNP